MERYYVHFSVVFWLDGKRAREADRETERSKERGRERTVS